MHGSAASPWSAHRWRAEALRERYGFAAEVLTLYLALLPVWEDAWRAARDRPPERMAGWAARHVLPGVVSATVAAGPKALAASLDGAGRRAAAGDAAAEELLAAWLAGADDDLVPVERYLARAALHAPLAAADPEAVAAACAADPAPRGDRRCPRCGGPPQLGFRTDGGDALVSGRRRLLCARCGEGWGFAVGACAGCGETSGERRTVYAERRAEGPQVGRREAADALFPHLSAEACATCRRFLVDVDLGRDPRAVPEVDELAALPLGLHAAEQGYTKVTPNVMGL